MRLFGLLLKVCDLDMYPHMYPKNIDAVNLLFKPFSGCGNHSSPIFRSLNHKVGAVRLLLFYLCLYYVALVQHVSKKMSAPTLWFRRRRRLNPCGFTLLGAGAPRQSVRRE